MMLGLTAQHSLPASAYYTDNFASGETHRLEEYLSSLIGSSSVRFDGAFDGARIEIEQLSAFEDNWDNAGAATASSITIANAHTVLQGLKAARVPAPEVLLNPNGTIQFDWETALGYASLEVGQTRVSFCGKLKGGIDLLGDGFARNGWYEGHRVGTLVSRRLFPNNPPSTSVTKIVYSNLLLDPL